MKACGQPLAASGESQIVQIGSDSTTVTPNVSDELVDALLNGQGEFDKATELLTAFPGAVQTPLLEATANDKTFGPLMKASIIADFTEARHILMTV